MSSVSSVWSNSLSTGGKNKFSTTKYTKQNKGRKTDKNFNVITKKMIKNYEQRGVGLKSNFTDSNTFQISTYVLIKACPPAWPWPASSEGIRSAPPLPGSSSRHPHQPFSCFLSSPYPPDPWVFAWDPPTTGGKGSCKKLREVIKHFQKSLNIIHTRRPHNQTVRTGEQDKWWTESDSVQHTTQRHSCSSCRYRQRLRKGSNRLLLRPQIFKNKNISLKMDMAVHSRRRVRWIPESLRPA